MNKVAKLIKEIMHNHTTPHAQRIPTCRKTAVICEEALVAVQVGDEALTDARQQLVELKEREKDSIAISEEWIKTAQVRLIALEQAETNVKVLLEALEELLRVGQFYPSAIEIDMYTKAGKNGSKNGEELKEMLIATIAKVQAPK